MKFKDLEVGKFYKKASGRVVYEVTEKSINYVILRDTRTDKTAYKNEYYIRNIDWVEVGEETPMNEKLFEFEHKGQVHYGKYLATDSNNNWVVEVKGTNEIVSLPKSKFTEVVPYTISLVSLSTEGTFDVKAEKDKYSVGEIYLVKTDKKGMGLVAVQKLDTKSKTPKGDFEPVAKVVVEIL